MRIRDDNKLTDSVGYLKPQKVFYTVVSTPENLIYDFTRHLTLKSGTIKNAEFFSTWRQSLQVFSLTFKKTSVVNFRYTSVLPVQSQKALSAAW